MVTPVYLLIHIVFSFLLQKYNFANIEKQYRESEQYREARAVQKEMLRIDILHCYCLSFPLRGNNVSVIINLSYCHVSKTVKSRTARKKIRGGCLERRWVWSCGGNCRARHATHLHETHSPSPPHTWLTWTSMRTRGAVAPCNRHMELISQLADDARYHPRSSAYTRTHQQSKSSELSACVLQFRFNIKMEKVFACGI